MSSVLIVCLIASICPGPATKSHIFPVLIFGLQFFFTESSLVVETTDPIKTEVGCILMFADAVKSKSTLVIPNKQMSGSPHNGWTLTILFNDLTCGNSCKLLEVLNLLPSTCDSVANPELIKSCGDNEKQPISDKSTSINIVCSPVGTPNII